MTKQELLEKADRHKSKIRDHGLMNTNQTEEVNQYFYNSFMESCFVEDRTLTNKDSVGYAEAFEYSLSLAATEEIMLKEDMIKKLHYLLYRKLNSKEAGHYRSSQAHICDTELLAPMPEEVAHLMEHFISQMDFSRRLLHPIEYAAICHKRFMDIYPFEEGNSTVAGLLMNILLVKEGYAVTVIPQSLQNKYIDLLTVSKRTNTIDFDAFTIFIAEHVIEAEKQYCTHLHLSV